MHLSQFHYLPLAPGFFSILIALFLGLLVIMVVLGAWRHAYLSLGVSPGTAMLLLLGSLIGSYLNVPIAVLAVVDECKDAAADRYPRLARVTGRLPRVTEYPDLLRLLYVKRTSALGPGETFDVSLKAAGWSFADNVTESNWGKRSKRGTGQVNTEHEPRWVRQLAAGARPWMTDGPP